MSPYYFETFACLEFVAFRLRWISLAERCRSSFARFILVLCAGFSLSLSSDDAVGGSQWKVQALSAGIRARALRWCSVLKKVFHLLGEVTTLMTSTYMLCLLL
jgi:hypothetical protein